MLARLLIPLVTLSQPYTDGNDRGATPSAQRLHDSFVSVQVNVDKNGENILGDAANGPTIAIDPTDPDKLVIAWRQFDSVNSNFRQAAWAYSHDGGKSWKAQGAVQQGAFRENPVLDADAAGPFYLYSLSSDHTADLFKSTDGGHSWRGPATAFGGTGARLVVDRSTRADEARVYCTWEGRFTKSTDGGRTFSSPVDLPGDLRGDAVAVGNGGTVYVAGITSRGVNIAKSTNAKEPETVASWTLLGTAELGGEMKRDAGPNPGGALGRLQLAVHHSKGLSHESLYLLASVDPPGADPLDVMFTRSTDGGTTWTKPVRINDDPEESGAWQWFGTLSLAPTGRIDVIWSDTRNNLPNNPSELYFASSTDGGVTWSKNVPVSKPFDAWLGWPNQNKLGDGYDMVSTNSAAHIAYAATFNREQDVYFLRIPRK